MIANLEAVCPSCGCTEVRSEQRSNQHCNGEWNEERTFRCGRTTTYVPNGHTSTVRTECDTVIRLLAANRQAVKYRLLEGAKALLRENLPNDAWGDRLIRAINDVRTS